MKGRVPKQTDDLEALHKSLVDEVAVPGAEKQDVEVVDDDSDEELKEEDDIWDTGEVGESESAKVARMKIQLETDPASFLGMCKCSQHHFNLFPIVVVMSKKSTTSNVDINRRLNF